MHQSEICLFAFLLLHWFDTFIANFKTLNLAINQLNNDND